MRRKGRIVAWTGALAGAMLLAAHAQEPAGDGAVREALQKWVEVRQQIAEVRSAWSEGKGLLEDRVRIVERETATLREKMAQTQRDKAEADKKLAELHARQEALRQATAGLGAAITGVEARVHALLARAPEPLREKLKPLSQRIPTAGGGAVPLTLSERFQNVVGVANEIDKFAREVILASEVRELPGGTRAEVTTLYLGLGPAYYCNLRGDIGGVGMPGQAAWTWYPSNAVAQAVTDAIAVYRNERPAAYVALPVELR